MEEYIPVFLWAGLVGRESGRGVCAIRGSFLAPALPAQEPGVQPSTWIWKAEKALALQG